MTLFLLVPAALIFFVGFGGFFLLQAWSDWS